MDSCFEFFFTNLPFCLKLGIEGVTGCGKRANFMGWQATPAFLWRFPRVASGNFRSSYAASIFLEYTVLVICACISVAGAKKKKKKKKEKRQPAWGTIEGSDEIGETPGGRLRSTNRLIIPVCIYLRTWSLVSLFSTSLLPLWIDLFEISSFLEFLDYVFFFFFFFPLFHESYESLSRDFSARRENSFFDGFIDQEFVKEFHGSVKILMIERHENGFNRFVNSRNALQLILIDSFSFFFFSFFSRKRFWFIF